MSVTWQGHLDVVMLSLQLYLLASNLDIDFVLWISGHFAKGTRAVHGIPCVTRAVALDYC